MQRCQKIHLKIFIWLMTFLLLSACQTSDTETSAKLVDYRNATFTQMDRVGRPAVATLLIQDNSNPLATTYVNKERFNRSAPAEDQALWRQTVLQTLKVFRSLYGDQGADAEVLADLLLPDVLTLNLSHTGTSSYLGDILGTNSSGGRALSDDVIDLSLKTVVFPGNNPALANFQSDGVPANDKQFLSTFPYLAPPHQP